MADGWDWLEGLSGAFSGVAKGLDQGMAPLKTWEGIRTTDLTNDKTEIGNRNLEYEQQAREGADVPAWYGDWRDAGQSTYRKTTAANEVDIFGNQNKLALGQQLTDPNGYFQMRVRQDGLEPGTPEYSRLMLQMIQQNDPTGMAADAAYDKFNVRGEDQYAASQQASISMVQRYLQNQTGDMNLQVFRGKDGKTYVDKDGALLELDMPAALEKAASLYGAATPEDASIKGMKAIMDINKGNADIDKAAAAAVTARNAISPQQRLLLEQEQRDISQEATRIQGEVTKIKASPEYQQALANKDQGRMTELMGDIPQRAEALRTRHTAYTQKLSGVQAGAGGGGGAGRVPSGAVAPGGPRAVGNDGRPVDTRVTAPRQSASNLMLGTPEPRMAPGTTYEEVDPYGEGGGWGADVPQAGGGGGGMPMGAPSAGVPMARSAGPGVASRGLGGSGNGGSLANLLRFIPSPRPNGNDPRTGTIPTGRTSNMSPEQLQAFLEAMYPQIQAQQPGGMPGGQMDPRLQAVLRSIGMMQ